MVQLASKGEAGLVIPMLDDFEYASSRASMLQAESDGVGVMEKTWQAVGGPEFKTKQSAGDPLLHGQGGYCFASKDAPNHHLGV